MLPLKIFLLVLNHKLRQIKNKEKLSYPSDNHQGVANCLILFNKIKPNQTKQNKIKLKL